MTDSPLALSRRQWLLGRWRPASETPPPTPRDASVAVIQGRRCLAYRGLVCSTCVEQCPVEGAIRVEQGVPQVVAAQCTGCRVCHAACPAPENAILFIPRL